MTVTITERWWDDSHGWSAAMVVIMVLQKGQVGMQRQWTVFIHKGMFHCTEPKDSDDKAEWLWVRIRGKADTAYILVGVCYRLHNQNEEADEVFHEWLTEVP